MTRFTPWRPNAVPQSWYVRAEILQAADTLAAQYADDWLRRRAEIAAIRRDLERTAQDLLTLRREWPSLLASELTKHSRDRARKGVPFANAAADRPMVLTGSGYVPIEANVGGEDGSAGSHGQRINADGQNAKPAIHKAAPDDPKHPGWPAGTPDGRGGKFRPKDEGGGGEGTPIVPSDEQATDLPIIPVAHKPPHKAPRKPPDKSKTHNKPKEHEKPEHGKPESAPEPSKPTDWVGEDSRSGGHIYDEHVGASEEYLKRRARETGKPAGSFTSVEAANKLINTTLDRNPETGAVVLGLERRATLDWHFDSPTGYEAFTVSTRREPEILATYDVRVVIERDELSPRGFRIVTAFPFSRR